MPGRLRVATWNVHSCIGSDGRHDPDRIRRIVRMIGADIVALQEVDSRIDGHDGFEDLGTALGPDRAHCRTLRTPDGDYGHMLLSLGPIREWTIRDISVPGKEPRSLIDAMIDTRFGDVRVLSTHLGLGRRERTRQVGMLRGLLEHWNAAVILLGDFNEATRFGPASRAFDAGLASAGRWRTFPAKRPILPLDRIWCGPPLHIERSWTLREAGRASDHLPLVADLRCSH
jgi:endonuclease/exonuclease/phosphatase family metal-dependent hydrolase